jgi:hypothetical protein
MRLLHYSIFAGALVVASPALAQDNAAAPGNTVANNGVVANSAAAAAPTTPTEAAATPGTQNATLPPNAATPADTGTTMAVKTHSGFPWGVLGLLGLIGLFGVRKVKA